MSSFNSTESSNQSNFIVEIIANIFNITNTHTLSIIIRKLAHYTEYLILGILVMNLNNNKSKSIYLSIIICLLYAISDEFHQSFVPGRSCQLYDVAIDFFLKLVFYLMSPIWGSHHIMTSFIFKTYNLL